MIPAFLITLREVIEASLIVATILGIMIRLKQHSYVKTVWIATGVAIILSVTLLIIGSVIGLHVQELYTGKTEELIEGSLMIISAAFITWAVFFLHNYFASYKTHLLQKITSTISSGQHFSIFILAFTAVFREGFEIVLFLTTIFFASNPVSIFSGFGLGIIIGLLVACGLFTASLRLPVYYAFRTTSLLLIVFAAGLLGRGLHEFTEFGLLPELGKIIIPFVPHKETFFEPFIKALFGITHSMDSIQFFSYVSYIFVMTWWVFGRKKDSKVTS